MKIGIRGGHNYSVQGANGIVNEVDEDRKITFKVIEYLRLDGNEVLDVTPDRTSTSAEDLKFGVSKANAWGADYFCSIHLNAFNSTSNGTECLYQSEKGRVIADRISTKVASLGFKNRGAKPNTRSLYELKYTNAVANIIECYFCDSQIDVDLYHKVGIDAIGKAIAEGIVGHDISIETETSKKYYIITNYLPQTPYGIELIGIIKKYFNSLDRAYIKQNQNGIWIETQYLEKQKAQELSDMLSKDNLLWKLVEE